MFFSFQFVLSLVNAKSSQMTNIYADIVHITMPMVFPKIWRALYSMSSVCLLVIFVVVAKEKCKDFWYLHISNQIVRWQIFFKRRHLWSLAFGQLPATSMQILLELLALSDYSLNWRVIHGKAVAPLLVGLKKKYKTTGTDGPEGTKTSQENVRILIKHS